MHKELYKEFRNEVGTAIASFYLWKKIEDIASNQKKLAILNITPLSWSIIRHSVAVTNLITLHRIFETDEECISADGLLKTYLNDISIFSTKQLRKRKDPNNENPEWLEEYIDYAYEPTEQDIHNLRGELRKRRKIFNEIYRPIRSKLIAHKVKEYVSISQELHSKGSMEEIEELLEFLYALKEALFELYMNGRKPDLTLYRINKRFYENDYDKLMQRVTGESILAE